MFDWLKKDRVTKKWLWGSLAAYIVMLVVNGLAGSTTLLGGVQTGEVSGVYDNLFTPAGFTFSIWGVIYLLLALFLLRAFDVIKTKKPRLKADVIDRLLVLFTMSSVFNALWLFAWQYQVMWLSVLVMLALLVTLGGIVRMLHLQKMGVGEYALVRVPFSVYAGWISVATIANIAAWLVSIEWAGLGYSEAAWTVAVLVLAGLVAMTKGLTRHDPLYVAVFVWAFFGILYKHMSESGYAGEHSGVIVAIAIVMPVLAMLVIQLMREHELGTELARLLKLSK